MTTADPRAPELVRRADPAAPSPSRGHRVDHRHHHRVVRLLPLRIGGRARLSRSCSFPSSDPFVGQILSFSTFFVGFVARPLGAALFGHFGDRIGRKALLVVTMMLMGVATMAVGLVPSYAVDRIVGRGAADVLPRAAGPCGRRRVERLGADRQRVGAAESPRVLHQLRAGRRAAGHDGGQPVAVGHGRSDHRRTVPRLGLAHSVSRERRCWSASASTSASASSSRRCSRRSRREGKVAKAPIAEVLRDNWREVALTTLVRTGQLAPYYIFTTYILTYGTVVLGLSRTMLLNLLSIRSITSILMIPLAGYVSDRFGRKRVIATGCIGTGLWGFVYFELLSTGDGDDDLLRDADRRLDAGSAVRAAGGAHLGGVPRVAPVYRFGARLPSGGDHGGWPGAGDCDLSCTASIRRRTRSRRSGSRRR